MKKRKCLWILMLAAALAVVLAVGVEAEDHGEVRKSGTCGKYVSYNWYNDGLVEITGTGDMDDYTKDNLNQSSEAPPWHYYRIGNTNPVTGNIYYNYYYPYLDVTKVDLNGKITHISDYIFSFCENIKGELILPEKLRSVGDMSFYNCSGFTGDLIIPQNVTTIGAAAFRDCSGFDGELVLPDTLTEIRASSFRGCSSLTGSLNIPEGIQLIEESAFSDCFGFSELILPDELTSIGMNAFNGCSGLKETLTIPKSVTEIGDTAFAGCTGLTAVIFEGEAPETVGENIFGTLWGSLTVYYHSEYADSFTADENYDPYTETWYGYSCYSIESLPGYEQYEFTKFEWSEDGKSANAIFTDKNDASSTITVDATVTAKITTPATCMEKGITTYTATATYEGFEYTDTTTRADIDALGHDWGEWEVTTPADCENKGEQKSVCRNDGNHIKLEVIPALGHTLTYVPAKAVTADADGNIAYYLCSACGKCFLDEAGREEIAEDDIVIPSLGYLRGDLNNDGYVDSEDAIYLLRHTMNEIRYPLNQSGDMNKDGTVDSDDAIYLLRHTMNETRYPL